MKRFILAILPFVLPLYVIRFHIGPLPTTLLEICLLAFFAAWTIDQGFVGWKKALTELRAKGWLFPLLFWLLAGIVAVVVAPNIVSGLGLWRAYFAEPVLVFVMLVGSIHTERDKKILLYSLLLVVLGMGTWALLQRLTGWSLPHPWDVPPNGPRATGPFPYPNALALFCAPVAAYCFWMVVNLPSRVSTPPLPRWLSWAGFVSGLVALVLAKSDGGMIALTTACVVVLLWRKSTRIVTVIIVSASLLTAVSIPRTRTILAEQFLFQKWSGQVRLVMWKETWNMLKDHPLTGAGLGGYPTGIKPYHKATWMEIFQYPHNILLNLWSETGILGVIAFTWIVWTSLAGRGWQNAAPTFAVMTAILVHGLVDVPYFKNDLAVLFWIMIFLSSFPLSETHQTPSDVRS